MLGLTCNLIRRLDSQVKGSYVGEGESAEQRRNFSIVVVGSDKSSSLKNSEEENDRKKEIV